jgi:hypothetical protein
VGRRSVLRLKCHNCVHGLTHACKDVYLHAVRGCPNAVRFMCGIQHDWRSLLRVKCSTKRLFVATARCCETSFLPELRTVSSPLINRQ